MKAFVDRSLPLCNTSTGETPVPKGKVGVGVAIRAGQSREENQHLIDTFQHFFGQLGIRMVRSLTAEGIDTLSDMENNAGLLEKAFSLGKTIVEMQRSQGRDRRARS
jgi:hypothetical protein